METLKPISAAPAVPLFSRGEARSHGMTDKYLRAHFRRVIFGVYTTWDTEVTHALRCQAVAMVVPEEAVITGRSAATLLGVPLAGPNDPVEMLISRSKYNNRGRDVRSWARKCDDDEHVAWGRIRRALPDRAGFDLLARNTLAFGVAHCDAMLRAGLLDEAAFRRFVGAHSGYYGIRKARRALEFLDPRAESIPESVLRVTLNLAGLHPTPQVEVFDEDGEFLARVDLAFEERRVVVEYDGEWHAESAQRERDLRRRRRLRECGWHVIVVTRDRLYGSPAAVVAEVQAALHASR